MHTLLRHLSLALQIALVAHDDDGKVVLVLYSEDLLLEGHDFLEALPARNAVHQQEALSRPHVLFTHGRVLLLAGCIEDIQERVLGIDHAPLAVRIWWQLATGSEEWCRARAHTFDCGIIFVDEVALDQLDGQAGFSDTTSTDDDELVLP